MWDPANTKRTRSQDRNSRRDKELWVLKVYNEAKQSQTKPDSKVGRHRRSERVEEVGGVLSWVVSDRQNAPDACAGAFIGRIPWKRDELAHRVVCGRRLGVWPRRRSATSGGECSPKSTNCSSRTKWLPNLQPGASRVRCRVGDAARAPRSELTSEVRGLAEVLVREKLMPHQRPRRRSRFLIGRVHPAPSLR